MELSGSTIVVRFAESGDGAAIAELLDSLDRYYGDTPEKRSDRFRNVESGLFSAHAGASALLAWSGSDLVGLATFSFLWPAAGSTRSLYLKELYVAESARRQGVGRRLMEEITRIARDAECSRVEWTADADNEEARLFYSALGTAQQQQKIFYRMTDF